MKATVKRDLCIGCGLCAEVCPEVFAMGNDMIAKVIIAGDVPATVLESAHDAASSCPVEAIELAED